MPQPLDIDIQVPLKPDGWVRLKVHVENLAGLSQANAALVLDVVDRMQSFARDLLGMSAGKDPQ